MDLCMVFQILSNSRCLDKQSLVNTEISGHGVQNGLPCRVGPTCASRASRSEKRGHWRHGNFSTTLYIPSLPRSPMRGPVVASSVPEIDDGSLRVLPSRTFSNPAFVLDATEHTGDCLMDIKRTMGHASSQKAAMG